MTGLGSFKLAGLSKDISTYRELFPELHMLAHNYLYYLRDIIYDNYSRNHILCNVRFFVENL